MAELLSDAARRTIVDKSWTEISLFAKEVCPDARVEATLESYEDEDGHVRVYPPVGLSEARIEAQEGKIAERCVDILGEMGVFICAAVYEPEQ